MPATDYLIDDEPLSVDLVHVRDHAFVKRVDGKRGCEKCKAGKTNMVHVGTPQSLNVHGSGAVQMAYQRMKQQWQSRLVEMLAVSSLPRGLGHVFAEGQMIFGDRRRRDQGNYRFMLEKALGDALVEGGWLTDDSWDHYEFGRLRYAYAKGHCATAVTLHPSWRSTEQESEALPLEGLG